MVIRFQPGIHTIGIEDTLRIPMFISNSMDSTDPQPVGILLQNVKHFRLEGSGAKGPEKPRSSTMAAWHRSSRIIRKT